MSVLVSVVVPNYNHIKYLGQRLKSIAEQTYRNLEIILLDDASSDNSLSLLDDFVESESRVKTLIKNPQNSGGAFSQWMKGVEQVTGKYLWIAETDDFSDLRFVETLVNKLEQNENAAVAYCHSNWIDSEGCRLGLMDIHAPYFKKNYWQSDFCLDGDEVNRDLMPYRNVIRNASSALFRTSTFKGALAGFTPSGKIDDWLFYVQLLKGNMLCFSDTKLNFCRLHASNFSRSLTSHSYNKNSRERINVLRKISALYPEQAHCVSDALKILWSNRFKYKAVDTLLLKHEKMGCYGLYGFNDLSKYFVSRCTNKPKVIFDKKVINSSYTGIPMSQIDSSYLSQLDTVVVTSIFYRAQMTETLKNMGYAGQVAYLEIT
jgi:glycosyltransferase involved in cell wall biosynthesis